MCYIWFLLNSITSHDLSVTQQKADVGSLGTTPLPAMQGKSGVQVGQAASGSSREDSDDDEPEGDTENTEGSDPVDDKRARRL